MGVKIEDKEMKNYAQRKAVINTLGEDIEKKYYVYALCEKTDAGELVPFYIGKGEGERVWAHEAGVEKEIEYIKKNVQKEHRKQAIEELYEKYKKIEKINKLGQDRIEKIIIKWGLTNDEAFMAESALINLLKIDRFSFSNEKGGLANIANGHSNVVEKKNSEKKRNGCSTKARTVEQFFKDCSEEPLDFEDMKNMNVALINISQGYPQCMSLDKADQKAAICDAARGFWKIDDNKHNPDYLFAIYQQRIVGVYRINKLNEKVLRSGRRVNSLYGILDLWREKIDYPTFDKVPFRKKDYEFAKKIYDACEKDSEGKVTNIVTYSSLSDELKEVVKITFGKLEAGKTYDDALKNWAERKYFSVENIMDTDIDANYNEFVGRRIEEYEIKENKETKKMEKTPKSLFSWQGYIRYTKE